MLAQRATCTYVSILVGQFLRSVTRDDATLFDPFFRCRILAAKYDGKLYVASVKEGEREVHNFANHPTKKREGDFLRKSLTFRSDGLRGLFKQIPRTVFRPLTLQDNKDPQGWLSKHLREFQWLVLAIFASDIELVRDSQKKTFSALGNTP